MLNAVKPNEKNIILGDFNDISGSVPLNKIERAGFTDAWWKGGNGYGATFPSSTTIQNRPYLL